MSATALTIVKGFYEAFAKGDLPGALSMLDAAVQWQLIGPDTIPYFGNYAGREGVERFFSVLSETVEYRKFEPQEFIAAEDQVIVLGVEAGVMKCTEESFETQWVHIFELKGGKITRFREYIDTVPLVVAYSA